MSYGGEMAQPLPTFFISPAGPGAPFYAQGGLTWDPHMAEARVAIPCWQPLPPWDHRPAPETLQEP